jgi:DNA polymerase
MDKQIAYRELVNKRKKYRFNNGLTNPSETSYDIDEIDPWAQWQNNLNADILVVGQEYSDLDTFNRTEAKVERYSDRYEYPSNKNLKEYFEILGYDIGHPSYPNQSHPIFFTNAVMGLKSGSMSGNFRDSWLTESREHFLKPLIDIIQPKIIIAIGAKATKSLGVIYNFKVTSHKSMVENSPIKHGSKLIFPVYHIGGLGLSNRPKAQQIIDWTKIKNYL